MGATAAVHPADPILQAYGLGKLDDVSSRSVSKHLDDCAACQSRVAELSTDSFLSRLRGAQGGPDGAAGGLDHSSESQTDRGPTAAIAAPPADTMPPGLADHADYEVIKELGRGGMGVVYLAHNRLMGRNEVLKVMSRHIIERPGLLARFLAEIRAVARLQHPNIVSAYSAFRLGASIIFAMEYVDGLDLVKMIKTKGPLPVAHASYFVSQAAQGMQHAHEQGMVHRDIKPGNLMLSHKGSRASIKILDFGLAKATREAPVDGGLTNPGQALGTPDYMAPEQIRDAQKADIRADIYSLGCTLYYLLSGGPPFRAENLWDLYQAHHSMDAKLLNFVRPDVPSELATLVAKMMAKEPGRRFQTPLEVAQALGPFFKKASANVRLLNPEVSQMGSPEWRPESPAAGSVPTQPATSLAPAPAPPARKPAAPVAPQTRWESLIEFKETEPLRDPVPAVKKAVIQKPRWLWPAAVAGAVVLSLIVLFVAWGVGTVKIKTSEGFIVLEDLPHDATVLVDDKKATVTWPGGGGPAEITVAPGDHTIRVKKDGLTMRGQTITVEAGGKKVLTVRLEPPDVARPEKPDPPATTPPTDHAAPLIADSTRFSVLSGVWDQKGDQLIQTDASNWSSAITFGDDRWTDYDFTVDFMREDGTGGVGLCVRSTDGNRAYLGLSVFQDKDCGVIDHDHGFEDWLKGANVRIVNRKWYTAHVHVRSDLFSWSLYDQESGRDSRLPDFTNLRHPSGRVGLATIGSSARFKNIKVTSPDGTLLWDGLPAVGSTTPSEVSGPADQAKQPVVGRDGFVQLFNGVDLTGWKWHHNQPGNWHVENGILVGSGPAAVSHLYTVRDDYKDFHLRLDARINDGGNSGVYFRAPFGPTFPANNPQWLAAYNAKFDKKRFGGLIVDGAIGRPVIRNQVPPFQPAKWITCEVIVQESHIELKVNGVKTADYLDHERHYSQGHIALQQHGTQTVVEFRKIEIKALPGAGAERVQVTQSATPKAAGAETAQGGTGFVPLFNGKDIAGWTAWGRQGRLTQADAAGMWQVEGGILHGIGGPSCLFSPRANYKNFRVRAEARINDGGNSGIFFRVADASRLTGYEAQINSTHRDPNKTGSLWLIGQPPIQVNPSPVPPETWFALGIEVIGARIRIWVNDTPYVDWTDPEKTYTQGHIAIQAHHPGSHVQIRKLEIMELDGSGKPITAGTGREEGGYPGKNPGTSKRKLTKRDERRTALRPPADAAEFRGKYDKVFPIQLSWHQARQRCLELGGHLAVVKNEEANRFLLSLMKRQAVSVVWLGATDEQVEATWVWVNGEPLRYNNWNTGQPNNKQGLEHYLIMMIGHDGKWSDQPNNSVQWSPGFICQWD